MKWLKKAKKCLMCEAKIDLDKDTYTTIKYEALEGMCESYLCEKCSKDFDEENTYGESV